MKPNNPESLETLLRATARGDRPAFARLYGMTSAKLFGVSLRILKRRDWSEDVLQEVFLRIWNNAAAYRPEKGSPMTWMITIARNRALDWHRRARAEPRLDEAAEPDLQAHPNPAPLDWTLAGAETREIKRCLDELDTEPRDCIVLAFVEGYTHQELAQRTNRPVGTVKSWIRRGLGRLKECLQR